MIVTSAVVTRERNDAAGVTRAAVSTSGMAACAIPLRTYYAGVAKHPSGSVQANFGLAL